MNSYFDDDTQTTQGSTGSDLNASAISNLDKGTIDTDLSKIFNQGGNAPEKVALATPSDNTVIPTATTNKEKIGSAFDTGADLTMDKPFDIKTDDQNWNKVSKSNFDDNPKKSEVDVPAVSSTGGSLATTEDKLNSRKKELSKQVSEIDEKLKKVDDTLAKIADLRKQEDELLKSVEEI